MQGDPERLRQVFINLADNAIKFSPEQSTVRLFASMAEFGAAGTDDGFSVLEPSRRMIEVRVIDSGIGVPEEERDRIFDPFYQVDSSSTRQHEGTGLGLSIVKRLVDAHARQGESEPQRSDRRRFLGAPSHRGLAYRSSGSADRALAPGHNGTRLSKKHGRHRIRPEPVHQPFDVSKERRRSKDAGVVRCDGREALRVHRPDSGKVKRLRNSSRARIAPCDARGNVKGEWRDATARIVDDAALIERAHQDACAPSTAGRWQLPISARRWPAASASGRTSRSTTLRRP